MKIPPSFPKISTPQPCDLTGSLLAHKRMWLKPCVTQPTLIAIDSVIKPGQDFFTSPRVRVMKAWSPEWPCGVWRGFNSWGLVGVESWVIGRDALSRDGESPCETLKGSLEQTVVRVVLAYNLPTIKVQSSASLGSYCTPSHQKPNERQGLILDLSR